MATEKNQWGMEVDPARPHLGGYFADGDPQSHCPELFRWLVEDYAVRSVLDVGCGSGAALRYFRDVLGVRRVLGIDGIEQEDADIIAHDYTTGPAWPKEREDFDLVWSCEFVEHVEARYMLNFLDTFTHGRLLLMTHAVPGQGGYHHVNCQEDDFWVGALATVDMDWEPQLTAVTRELAGPNTYYGRTGLAFVRSSDWRI